LPMCQISSSPSGDFSWSAISNPSVVMKPAGLPGGCFSLANAILRPVSTGFPWAER
jgi:hypothetical protein